jgi:tetratricopeptide (TPR) repeat protein
MQRQALDLTLLHLPHHLEAVFEAERRMGIFCYFAGEQENALRHFKAAHQVLKNEDELGSAAAAELLVNIAATQLKSNRPKEALAIYAEAARLISQQRGPSDLFFAAVLNNEGCVHLQVGQNEQALECFNRCLWAYKHNPATDDASRAEVFHNLAVTLEKTGNTGLAGIYRRSAAELLEQLTQECREKLIIATRTGTGLPSANATMPGAERPTVQTFSRLPSPQANRVKVSRLALPIKTETIDWDF